MQRMTPRDMVGKIIESVEHTQMTVTIYFTDGSWVEIRAHSSEEGWITVDGDQHDL